MHVMDTGLSLPVCEIALAIGYDAVARIGNDDTIERIIDNHLNPDAPAVRKLNVLSCSCLPFTQY